MFKVYNPQGTVGKLSFRRRMTSQQVYCVSSFLIKHLDSGFVRPCYLMWIRCQASGFNKLRMLYCKVLYATSFATVNQKNIEVNKLRRKIF